MNRAFLPPDGLPAFARDAASLLRDLGLTHVVTLPDNESAPLLEALRQQPLGSSSHGSAEALRPEVVWATREGEAIALASGLWLGGGHPAVLIQNTGFLEAGDALRGTASRMGTPLLLLVTCRGFAKARALNQDRKVSVPSREILVRNDLDSVAFMTENTLDAWGIPFLVLSQASELSAIRRGWSLAHEEERPVAVLLDTPFS